MRPLPINTSDYKTIIEKRFAYIDKTVFVEKMHNLGTNTN